MESAPKNPADTQNSDRFEFFPLSEMAGRDKSKRLARAVEDFENFFFHEKDGRLYGFLLAAVEKPLIENILGRTEGNQIKAAKILGINRNTLHAKIKKLKIDVRGFKNWSNPSK